MNDQGTARSLRQEVPTEPIPDHRSPVLVAGATGYIGNRLVPRLLARGYEVQALARSEDKLADRSWADHKHVDLISANVLNEDQLNEATSTCRSVYYLIHSLGSSGEDFESADRQAAQNMVAAARKSRVNRLIYLGGLGDEQEELSPHLASRAEVARIFRESDVPTTILRAGVILGSGSASFEILRHLVERLPIMTTPRWVHTKTQPIGIRNVLSYLVGALEHPEMENQQYDIGGSDVLTYQELMQLYAEVAGLPRRLILPVPVLTPRLSAGWVHIVTPVPANLARPLIEGLRNPAICNENAIRDLLPIEVLSSRKSINLALQRIDEENVESRWSDAGELPVESIQPGDPDWAGETRLTDVREIILDDEPEAIWEALIGIGGANGWYGLDLLWRLRGWMDRLVGGVGHSRGRRDPAELQVGDALDFWRVKALDRPRKLVLRAEMKLPGKAWLKFELESLDHQRLRCQQTAVFEPSGLLGLAYWYSVDLLHGPVFNAMLRGIARQADVDIHSGPDVVISDV